MSYNREFDGQRDFYAKVLPVVAPNLTMDDVLGNYTDGVVNGNIIEFKLAVHNLNVALYQAIKYLSNMRIKGKSIPANIVIVDVNKRFAWCYKSEDYLCEIEQLYTNAPSRNNEKYVGCQPVETIDYNDMDGYDRLLDVLRTCQYTKIHLDENCIVGWAKRYYAEVPNATKADFIGDNGEIRKPKHFEKYIEPYSEESNKEFDYLMDVLNDKKIQKELGAFYTPKEYAELACKLVEEAVQRVPEGNDYIILDRCAGTGNLEQYLSDELLSHCVLSTYEYYEYRILIENFQGKVRHIFPDPITKKHVFDNGLVKGGDALSKDFIENTILKRYIDDPTCTIIMFENPPYALTNGYEFHQKKFANYEAEWRNSFVVEQFKKDGFGKDSQDKCNAFIWSAFEYYLRKPEDSYIVFSPIKYWQVAHIIDKKFIKGYAFNRKMFNASTNAMVSCIEWQNIDEKNEKLFLEGYDLNKNGISNPILLPVQKMWNFLSEKANDKRTFPDDKVSDFICEFNGKECNGRKTNTKGIYNENILGYMIASTAGFDNQDGISSLLAGKRYNSGGFYLRKDNFLEKMPVFAATRYFTYNPNWTVKGRIVKTSDNWDKYIEDVHSGKLDQYTRKCLLFNTLEMQNHIHSQIAKDGTLYLNQLCLDNTHGKTVASEALELLDKDEAEEKLLEQWNIILDLAKQTKNYNKDFNYGVHQIKDDLNTTYKTSEGKTVYDYVELNSALCSLKTMLSSYYNEEIAPTLFEYEILK